MEVYDLYMFEEERVVELEERLKEVRAEELAETIRSEAKDLQRSNTQLALFMFFMGLSLVVLNVLVITNLGWSAVWSDVIVLYTLTFGLLTGIFLITSAWYTFKQGQKRTEEVLAGSRHEAKVTIDRQLTEEKLQELQRGLASKSSPNHPQSYRGGYQEGPPA